MVKKIAALLLAGMLLLTGCAAKQPAKEQNTDGAAAQGILSAFTTTDLDGNTVTAQDAFGGYEMTLFRPPMGEYSVQSLCAVQNLGYRSVFWSFAYRDWLTDAQPEPWEALQKIVGCAHGGGIYLLHAVSETNAAVLANAIDSLRAQGYTLSLLA